LLFDSNTRTLYKNRHQGTFERKLNYECFTQRLLYDEQNDIYITEFEFADGEIEEHKQRPYNLNDLVVYLQETGLKLVDTFSDLDKTPFNETDERLFILASKSKL